MRVGRLSGLRRYLMGRLQPSSRLSAGASRVWRSIRPIQTPSISARRRAVYVRLLGEKDLDLLLQAPREVSGGPQNARRMLGESIIAGAVIDGRIVGRVEAYCRTALHAN